MLANFKAALAARRIKQVDLAYDVRMSSSRLSEIVNERRQANALTRKRIAHVLGVDEAWLFSASVKLPKPGNSDGTENDADPI
jgi:transcriptional regulator with XRE-family HTH domain